MRKTILIVDDSETEASTLEIALSRIPGVSFARASNGHEALELLRGSGAPAFHAVVTDLNMPRMDGFELIEEVRAHPATARLPILVLTGDTKSDTPERLARLGVDGYLTKPYSPAEVRSRLEQLLHAQPT